MSSSKARRFARKVSESESESDSELENKRGNTFRKKHIIEHDDEIDGIRDVSDSDLSESEIERRRDAIRKRLLHREKETVSKSVLLNENNDDDDDSEEETDDSDEESDDEVGVPRLKPVFVSKKDRITITKKQMEEFEQKQLEAEKMIAAEERRKQTLKLVEQCVKKEQKENKFAPHLVNGLSEMLAIEAKIDDVNTDDENDEVAYEQWKLRELKRLKRDKEEREQYVLEKADAERLRNMTDEERKIELKNNPKQVTNKAMKGKYKFLQKYYHRGAFYLDKEDEVFKRDFSSATLEDQFDKTILPKVMQVKNFGKAGRTKYTHLVDQDTTQFDNPWSSETTQNLKFYNSQAAGLKQSFSKPSFKKRRVS